MCNEAVIHHDRYVKAKNSYSVIGRDTHGMAIDSSTLCCLAADLKVAAINLTATLNVRTGYNVEAYRVTSDKNAAAKLGARTAGIFDNTPAAFKDI